MDFLEGRMSMNILKVDACLTELIEDVEQFCVSIYFE